MRNRSYKSFKYYLAENGDLYLDTCLIATAEDLRADTVYTMLDVLVKHITRDYPSVMRAVWTANET